jgi:hypothetical protein
MAKIYETQDDFERDKLREQAKDLRLKSEKQVTSGMGWVIVSTIPSLFSRRPAWLDYLATLVGIVGIIDLVRSWGTSSKAHDLELQRERLGPGVVVLPPRADEVALAGAQKDDCGACKHTKLANAPKSPLDYVEKVADLPVQR